MNEVYLRNWVGSPLYCPFCGTKLDTEALREQRPSCPHVFVQLHEARFVYTSDRFLRLVADHFHPSTAGWADDLAHQGRIMTDNGWLSAREMLKQMKIRLENDWLRCVHFRCDEGSDVGDVTFVADE